MHDWSNINLNFVVLLQDIAVETRGKMSFHHDGFHSESLPIFKRNLSWKMDRIKKLILFDSQIITLEHYKCDLTPLFPEQ